MRILVYLAIAVIAAYLGYKIAEITILNKQMKSNVAPIVAELKVQLTALQNELNQNITAERKAELEAQKDRILDLLAKFYGYSKEQLTTIFNNAA